ncbi:hypothetical protein P3T42_005920 [Paraburkholderia sp. GAS38]|uniref:hypothetical protein n=1 Tax=Paraburkholderia sp. GAS38 TaxID=3035133 RepID=UPI003D1E93F0
MESLLHWIEIHPGTATWVQAIGSMLAIAIAIWVPYRQRRGQIIDDRKQQTLKTQSTSRRYASLLNDSIHLIRQTRESLHEHVREHRATTGNVIDPASIDSIYARALALETESLDEAQGSGLSLLRTQLGLVSNGLRPQPGWNVVYGERHLAILDAAEHEIAAVAR